MTLADEQPVIPLREREVATTAVGLLLEHAAAGRGGCLFVVGEAGLGKTSILNYACRHSAVQDWLISAARGDPMETVLPFGLLAKALGRLCGGEILRRAVDVPTPEDARDALTRHVGQPVVRRYSGGADIQAACGTLAGSA